MAITKNEVDSFVARFKKDTESFIFDLQMHSQEKEGDEIVNINEDYSLSERIEIMILSLKHFGDKSEIKIYVGKIDSV